MTQTASITATEIVAAVRSGALSARTATEQALERIDRLDGRLGAFQVVRTFAALREADAVDLRPERFSLRLAGLPIAIKDNVPVAGEPMRDGSAGSSSAPQQRDHEVVRRLRAAGAVVVGITRVPELCVFGATDSVYGITHNPWRHDRTPGGSSGGAAAAVAAGMVPVAHGNDGMGSIRIPSACCGLVGIKPGRGVVPADLGNGSWFNMSENGPLATTVADCALVFSVLAGRPEFADVTEPGSLRIAISTKAPSPGLSVNKYWAAGVRETAELLADAGHRVTDATPAYGMGTIPAAASLWAAGTEMDARLLADRSRTEPRTRRHAALGRAAMRLGATRDARRNGFRGRAEHFFAEHDVLVTPTLAQWPLRSVAWGERGWLVNFVANARYAPFCAPWNLLGWPAMAVPAGLGPDGMPLSVQLVTRPGGEATLLGLALQLERLRPWPRTAPAPGRSGSGAH
jgi:amidase